MNKTIIRHRITNEVILELEGGLSNADLSNADLSNADLSNADLSNADLSDANLYNANLSNARLVGADLSNADLSDADLSNANLSDANLYNADLSDANLYNANLSDANLSDADLSDADLSGVYLRNTIGNINEVKSMQLDTWNVILWNSNEVPYMAIGCRQYTQEEWWNFDDETINKMDREALAWWKRWKPILQEITKVLCGETI